MPQKEFRSGDQETWEERPGTWQEVYVRSVIDTTTTGYGAVCILELLQWGVFHQAVSDASRGVAVGCRPGKRRCQGFGFDGESIAHASLKVDADGRYRAERISPMA